MLFLYGPQTRGRNQAERRPNCNRVIEKAVAPLPPPSWYGISWDLVQMNWRTWSPFSTDKLSSLPHTTFYKYRTSITDIPLEKLNLEQSYNYVPFGQTELKSSEFGQKHRTCVLLVTRSTRSSPGTAFLSTVRISAQQSHGAKTRWQCKGCKS